MVKPRDTLWSISEKELGTPLDWRRIAEANYGRMQLDGEQLTDDHWIRPGWVLVIPTAESPSAAPASRAVPPAVVISMPDREGQVPIDTEVSPVSVVTTSTEATVNGATSPRTPDRTQNGAGVSSKAPRAPVKRGGSSGPHIPVTPIGYGLLGAGVVTLLDRMRRAQQRLRPNGLRIALPEGDLVELERGLRVAADPASAEWIDLSLRLLAARVRRQRLNAPMVRGVRLRGDAVEIMLASSSPLTPPPPFDPGPNGKSWILVKSRARIEQIRADSEIVGVEAPLPSLVTLGRDTLGLVMVNIETAGSVAVSGPDADLLVHAIAVELATAAWSDQIDLILVGFGEGNEGLERVSHARSLAAVGARMERRVRERAALLASVDWATNGESRWQDTGDAWDLCVVVCSPTVSINELSALAALIDVAGDGSFGLAVICGRDVTNARWRVGAEAGRVSVRGAGFDSSSVSLQPVPPDLVEGVASLVSVAAQTSGVPSTAEPYASLSIPIPERETRPSDVLPDAAVSPDGPVTLAGVPDQPDVVVRVLGPVEIKGAARQFTRAWAIELIVYLAMHPGGVSNEQWATALWPDKAMAPASLHSTASAARRSLGMSVSGDDHLPRSRGRLALGPHVQSDWATFVDLSRSSRPDDWRTALTLVRGRPFDDLRSPDWVILEGILAAIEAGVVDLACRFAHHRIEVLDPAGAEWAARQGLRVSPYDERLYRVLLVASNAAGNPAGVESVMSELVHLVADDVEPFDAVHPETLALYRQLSRRASVSRSS